MTNMLTFPSQAYSLNPHATFGVRIREYSRNIPLPIIHNTYGASSPIENSNPTIRQHDNQYDTSCLWNVHTLSTT